MDESDAAESHAGRHEDERASHSSDVREQGDMDVPEVTD
jgi:hypothetical protein